MLEAGRNSKTHSLFIESSCVDGVALRERFELARATKEPTRSEKGGRESSPKRTR